MDFKKKVTKEAKKAFHVLAENKLLLAQFGVMGIVLLSGDTSFANTSDGGNLSVVVSPLQTVQETISGPIATAVGTAGAGLLGLSVAMNFENSIAKRAVQGAGGIGLGLGGAKAIGAFGTTLIFL